MAASATLLTSGSNTSSLDTYNTASVTPGANRLILLFAITTGPSITAVTAVGNGLTWVEVASVAIDVRRLTVFRAMGAAPTAGAITIDPNNSATSAQWAVVEYAGVDTSGTDGSGAVVQSKGYINAAAATSAAITLDAAIGPGNATTAGFGIPAQEAITPGTGYTELAETMIGGPNGTLEVEFDATGTTTADASWTSSLANVVGVAVEIADAAAGGTTVVVGTAAETDSAPALVRSKTKVASATTETGSAQTLVRAKSRPAAVAASTEAALALGRAKTRVLGSATETDTAPVIIRQGSVLVPVGTATETSTATGIGGAKARTLAAVSAADLALTLGRLKTLGLAPPLETGLALQLGRRKIRSVSTVTETGGAVLVWAAKTSVAGAATETDLALTIGALGGLAPRNLVWSAGPLRLRWAAAAPEVRWASTAPAVRWTAGAPSAR